MKQEIKMGDDYSVNETENEDGSLLICPIQKDRSQKKKIDEMTVLARLGGKRFHFDCSCYPQKHAT